eukprot:GABV01000565.1.p1 GENE.GABV01000565.1~~GABV01000565.1.p1  ORF type:complete len:397 (+),score=111.12 GABV01000565.1:104-1192(+)
MSVGSEDESVEKLLAKHNLLVRILRFSTHVLLNGTKTCMICDSELDFVGVRPTVCSRPSCSFSYEEIGLGFDLSYSILNEPELVDLLILLCYSATTSNRISLLFPDGVRGGDPATRHLSFMTGTPDHPAQDVEKLKDVLQKCPSVDDLIQICRLGGNSALKAQLSALDPLLYPLLQWLLTSNRAHLRLLRPEERIKDIDTPWQFVFVSSVPEKEANFQRLRRRVERSRGTGKGSILTWHGSPLGNWHSILRSGLKNYSGTKNQMHGAAYGKGIYMAVESATSLGYCRNRAAPGWPSSRFGTSPAILALCEVVNDPKLPPPKPFYVVPNEEWVTTRFFFVLPANSMKKKIVANDLKLPPVFAQ